MKKIITIFIVIFLSLFILIQSLSSSSKESLIEDYHSIKFDNLNSKNLNKLFEDLNGTVIEIEVKTKSFTKAYRLNTSYLENIEKSLTEKVIKDLQKLGETELSSLYKISGFKITRIDLICSDEVADTIKHRSDLDKD